MEEREPVNKSDSDLYANYNLLLSILFNFRVFLEEVESNGKKIF